MCREEKYTLSDHSSRPITITRRIFAYMVKCNYCGKEFERKYLRQGYVHVFCSRECTRAYGSIRQLMNNNNNKIKQAWRTFNKIDTGYYENVREDAKGLSRVPPNQRKIYLEEAKKLLSSDV